MVIASTFCLARKVRQHRSACRYEDPSFYLLVAPELHAALQRAQLRPGGIDVGKLLDESLQQGFSWTVGFGSQPFFDERPTVSEGIDPRPPPVFGGGLSPLSGVAVNLLPRRREPVEKRR